MSTATEKAPTAPENTNTGKTTFSDVAKVSELKEHGWRVEGSGRSWKAYENKEGGQEVGPASSLNALHTQVMLKVGPSAKAKPAGNGKANGKAAASADESFELTNESGEAPKTGKKHKVKQPTLPNTQNAVLEDLRTAILSYRDLTMQVLDLQERQADEKKLVMALMHKFEDELTVDPQTGTKSFQAEMIIAELLIEEKEVLKTRAA